MHWRLVLCASCGLLYSNPAPDASGLAAEYTAAAYDSQEEARYAARTYADVVQPLVASLPNPPRILDIGAGDGAFLERMLEMGFADAVGFEPSAAAREAAPPTVRGLLRGQPFDEDSAGNEPFSLATCFQTVEHLSDPLGLCRSVRKLLRPSGAFVVVCHDREALSAKLLGRRSPIYDIEHLQLFSRSTLRELLERAGFSDIDIGTLVNRYPLRYWLRLAPMPDVVRRTLLRTLGPAGSVSISVPAGNLYAVGRAAAAD
jgi:SAM-dependent methyltransferase